MAFAASAATAAESERSFSAQSHLFERDMYLLSWQNERFTSANKEAADPQARMRAILSMFSKMQTADRQDAKAVLGYVEGIYCKIGACRDDSFQSSSYSQSLGIFISDRGRPGLDPSFEMAMNHIAEGKNTLESRIALDAIFRALLVPAGYAHEGSNGRMPAWAPQGADGEEGRLLLATMACNAAWMAVAFTSSRSVVRRCDDLDLYSEIYVVIPHERANNRPMPSSYPNYLAEPAKNIFPDCIGSGMDFEGCLGARRKAKRALQRLEEDSGTFGSYERYFEFLGAYQVAVTKVKELEERLQSGIVDFSERARLINERNAACADAERDFPRSWTRRERALISCP